MSFEGLITPSLEDDRCKGDETSKMNLPLLIGGATTSRVHTAVSTFPQYENVIYVTDASRAVGVVGELRMMSIVMGIWVIRHSPMMKFERRERGKSRISKREISKIHENVHCRSIFPKSPL